MNRGVVVWFTGLPSSGKSTLASAVRARLLELGRPSCVLDGDTMRAILGQRGGYARADRDAFYDVLGRLAAELAWQGLAVLVPATADRREYREDARKRAPSFIEVWLATPLAECRRRDAKGLYRMAERGELRDLPGVDAEYQPPSAPDVTVASGEPPAVERILELVSSRSGQLLA